MLCITHNPLLAASANGHFKVEKNITTGLISIFDIKINQSMYKGKINGYSRYNIRNSQELKSLVKKIINS